MTIRYKSAPRRVQLTSKEISRGDSGWAVAARPQPGGGYMVAVVDIDTAKPWGPKVPYVDDRTEIQSAIQGELRMMDKLGFDIPMAGASRFRFARTSLEQQWGC
jgi:hypothetical protein